MVYDSTLVGVVIFGGVGRPPQPLLDDTWLWKGGRWQQITAGVPSGRVFPMVAYDRARNELVVFGGAGDNVGNYADTWLWDGSSWRQSQTNGGPPGRIAGSTAYDEARGEVVLFGGQTYTGRRSVWLNDTWIWNGETWSQRQPASEPDPRSGASVAYDSATGNVFLFGGGTTGLLSDTWMWNGQTWVQLNPSASPAARSFAGLAFDRGRGVTVLFGGVGFPQTRDAAQRRDMWVWDGSSWTEEPLVGGPPGGHSHSLVYDDASQSIVLFRATVQKPKPPVIGTATMTPETWVLR